MLDGTFMIWHNKYDLRIRLVSSVRVRVWNVVTFMDGPNWSPLYSIPLRYHLHDIQNNKSKLKWFKMIDSFHLTAVKKRILREWRHCENLKGYKYNRSFATLPDFIHQYVPKCNYGISPFHNIYVWPYLLI